MYDFGNYIKGIRSSFFPSMFTLSNVDFQCHCHSVQLIFFSKKTRHSPPIRKHPQCASTKRGAEGCHISQQGCLCAGGGGGILFFRRQEFPDLVFSNFFWRLECAVSQHFRHFWSVRVQHLSIHPSNYSFGISLIPTITLSYRRHGGGLSCVRCFPPCHSNGFPPMGPEWSRSAGGLTGAWAFLQAESSTPVKLAS